ncbi:hypothetical protein BDN72DRAFT_959834 [Pluteus cervinus]|uniref:Uncharacterized protein n=1 Tax=Pluteus cervinus TaxID=181527 RepID=A0ACD3AUP1_9AGAR|nr:hypothetical protein BDN72DRAFT_959834 [Pluteus cervinus]
MNRPPGRINLRSGDIGAIRASINHPLLRYLRDYQTVQLSEIASHRVESAFDGVTTENPDNLKFRPCLYTRERETPTADPQELIFLMGTLEGKKKLDIDAFTQNFVIPIYPTNSYGDYRMKLIPPSPKSPAYLIAYPLARGESNPIEGRWHHRSRDPDTNQVTDTTYRVDIEELALFRNERLRKLKRFSKHTADFREHAIRQFLKQTGRPSASSRRVRGRCSAASSTASLVSMRRGAGSIRREPSQALDIISEFTQLTVSCQ